MVTSSHYAVSDLRVYPPRFAQAVSGLMERMKSTCKGQPEIPAGQTPVAIEVMELEWECDPELWSFVDFGEIFTYLRGSKRLNIPDSWKHIIPRKLPIETSGGSSDWILGFLKADQLNIRFFSDLLEKSRVGSPNPWLTHVLPVLTHALNKETQGLELKTLGIGETLVLAQPVINPWSTHVLPMTTHVLKHGLNHPKSVLKSNHFWLFFPTTGWVATGCTLELIEICDWKFMKIHWT